MKHQGYNARLDDSLGSKHKGPHSQSLKDRRDESKGMAKKNPSRCLPLSKAKSLTKAQRAATAKKKKRSGGRKQFVMNTKKAKVRG